MSNDRISAHREFDFGFSFLAYDVRVVVAANDPSFLEKLRAMVGRAFGSRVEFFADRVADGDHEFGVMVEDGLFRLFKNRVELSSGTSERNLLKHLNSLLRLEVAEFAKNRVFVHAGVVGWNGQAILLPGPSFAGKSTLTAELIRNGAEYYSDEYAVLDDAGRVGPFPRHLSLRFFGATREKDVKAEDLGARVGTKPIPVGLVLFTRFTRGAEWSPETLTPGSGIMDLIPNTLTMHRDPAFALKVLDLVARRAIMVKSPRGDVKKFAKFLLAFFDKHSKSAKMT